MKTVIIIRIIEAPLVRVRPPVRWRIRGGAMTARKGPQVVTWSAPARSPTFYTHQHTQRHDDTLDRHTRDRPTTRVPTTSRDPLL